MFAFASLLYNNIRDGEMLFKIQKLTCWPRFLYFKQHFNTKEVIIYYKHANKNIILILPSVNSKLTFILVRETKLCQYVLRSANTPRYLIVCRRSVMYFLFMYIKNKIHILLYTILAINIKDQISIIGFLSRKIRSVFK